MGEETGIAWCNHTFNPWWGCTKVSAGCDNCYAEKFDRRVGGSHWGAGSPRRTFGDAHWQEPLKWNKAAEEAGERRRVFCASMADVFDAEAPEGARERLWALIEATPNLDWLLLTKRPANIRRMVPEAWMKDGFPRNVWLGTSVEDQQAADARIPALLMAPAAVRFLSIEPLIGPVDLTRLKDPHWWQPVDARQEFYQGAKGGIHWVIVGGESGPGARRLDMEWVKDLWRQVHDTDIAWFWKQTGSVLAKEWGLKNRKGEDPREVAEVYAERFKDNWPSLMFQRWFQQTFPDTRGD